MATLAILIVMYWGDDGRSSMTTAEFSSIEKCEAARAAMSKEFNSSFKPFDKAYSVCTEK